LSLGLDRNKIRRFIEGIENESRAVIKEVSMLSVWGNISPSEIWNMTHEERMVLSEVIKEHTDTMYGKKGIARR
jgi:predicted amidohydrolase